MSVLANTESAAHKSRWLDYFTPAYCCSAAYTRGQWSVLITLHQRIAAARFTLVVSFADGKIEWRLQCLCDSQKCGLLSQCKCTVSWKMWFNNMRIVKLFFRIAFHCPVCWKYGSSSFVEGRPERLDQRENDVINVPLHCSELWCHKSLSAALISAAAAYEETDFKWLAY